jgi:hypothetical protein
MEELLFCEGSNEIIIAQPNNPNCRLRSEKSNLIEEWVEKNQSRIFGKFPEHSFELASTIGEGSYGKMYLTRIMEATGLFALKEISKRELIKKSQLGSVIYERNILASLHCSAF